MKQPEKSSTQNSAQNLSKENATKSNAIEIPQISLPKGGGALKGIDEKFQVNAANGTSSFSIPLPFSPNRNGFTPQLSLSYNSGTGNGLFGIGWDIDLPAIQRRTDKKLPRYFDTNDVTKINQEDSFMFSGVEELVPLLDLKNDNWEVRQKVIEGFTVRQYRPRIEGSFSRIERIYKADSGYYWKVTSKENITTFFGYSEECRIYDLNDKSKVFQWLPEFAYDDKGSWIWYEYKAENTDNVAHEVHEKNRKIANNKHIKRIKYGNETAKYFDDSPFIPILPNNEKYFFEVVFDYGEHGTKEAPIYAGTTMPWQARHDAFSSYRSGFEMRTYRLCRRVMLFHHFEELGNAPTLVRAISFEYDFSTLYNKPKKPENNPIEVTYLSAIEQIGYIKSNGNYSFKSLPKMTFTYQKLNWHKDIQTVSEENLVHAPTGLSGNYQWTDLYNEGINGILTEQANAWFYKSNFGQVQIDNEDLGNLHFSQAKLIMPKPSFLGIGNGTLQLQDLDANGEKQLVINSPGLQGYFELTNEGEWQPFKAFAKTLNLDLKDPNVKMLDVNGDGKPEVLLSEQGAFWWWENQGKVGYDSPELATKPYDEEAGAAIVFADSEQKIYLSDMSGDGLTDIVRIRNGEICYWANLGYGRFGAKVTMSNSPIFDNPELFNPAYLQLTDISGTGVTDIIYLGKNQFKAYLNLSGNAWSEPEIIEPFFLTEQPNRISVTDLLGNGTACIVWSSELPAYQQAPMRYIDLMGGKKPHIMVSHENGMGKKTEVIYKSSTYFYLKDKLQGTLWITKLPFPVQVVTKTVISDIVTNVRFTSQYTYHHGYYDHVEREFRGFGRVEQMDAEDFDVFIKTDANNINEKVHHQPPVLTKTWFHTGAFIDKERILTQFKNEYWFKEFNRKSQETPIVSNELALPDAILLAAENLKTFDINKLSAEEWREALRACKGMTLRQEVFGLDAQKRIDDEKLAKGYVGDEEDFIKFSNEAKRTQQFPYSVATHTCEIVLLQERGNNHFASFIVKESETISYTYERNPEDPRIAHTLNLQTDELGNILESVAVVYPRLKEEGLLLGHRDDTVANKSAKQKGREGQKKQWITFTKNDFTKDIISTNNYYLRKNWQTQTYELTGIKPSKNIFSIVDFKDKVTGFTEIAYEQKATEGKQKRLIEHIKTKFYNENVTAPMTDGVMAIRAIPFESYQLAYTPNLLQDIFTPSAFSTQFEVADADMLRAKYLQDNTNWWIQSGTVKHFRTGETFENLKSRFFAPVGYIDPFDSETEVFYDPKNLFMERAVAILDKANNLVNESRVLRFNYRTLSPDVLKDLNDNISSVIVDELGLVKATAIEGKAGMNALQGEEADNLNGLQEQTNDAENTLIQSFFNLANTAFPAVCAYNQLQDVARQLLGNASARMVYDFSRQPAVVASIVREQHTKQNVNSPLQISFEYTDGLGKVAMKKVQAESGIVASPDGIEVNTGNQLRWVGNGRTVLNNKGNPIKQYEPYFSTTPAYENDPIWVEQGVSPKIYYDGAGRNSRTELPNGTFTKVVFDAWKQLSYDVNDTVLESQWYKERITLPVNNPEYKAAKQTELHANTPSIIILDTLGRPTLGIDLTAPPAPDGGAVVTISPIGGQGAFTSSEIDIEGNALSVIDTRGNVVMAWRYDMLGHRVAQTSMDAGKRWMLNDGGGKPIKSWDERQQEFTYQYDALHRPTKKFVNGGDGAILLNHCYESIIYGETLPNAKAKNWMGKAAILYDTAGKVISESYDFKGNLLSSSRIFATDYKNTPDWNIANPDDLLDGAKNTFTQSMEYDALNRPIKQTTPDGKITMPAFNPAGLLDKVTLREGTTNTDYVKNIDYDEKGQRTQITYGNDVTTKYEYDKKTFRLKSLKSSPLFGRGAGAGAVAGEVNGGAVLQDLNYTYDPTGNITQIQDNAIPIVFFNNQKITGRNEYTYDALYRLTDATGREQNTNSPNFGNEDNWNDAYAMLTHNTGDTMAMRNYAQRYQYDGVGNILQMKHIAGDTGSWTRDNTYETKNNRIKNTSIGNNTLAYQHHTQHGFMTSMPHLSQLTWTFKEEIQATAKQVINNGTPETTYYVYDGTGQRTRKITENQANVGTMPTLKDERVYVGSYEIYRNSNGLERETLQIMAIQPGDDKSRIAMLDTETEPRRLLGINLGRTTPIRTQRYQMGNHLDSVSLELDENAQTISYEEYHPYGTTAYQAKNANIQATAKRYRYTGMERDEETGLEYHAARYYMPWLGRWCSADPIGIGDGVNVYVYVKGNPICKIDLNGRETEPCHYEDTGTGQGLSMGVQHENGKTFSCEVPDSTLSAAPTPKPSTPKLKAQLPKKPVELPQSALPAVPPKPEGATFTEAISGLGKGIVEGAAMGFVVDFGIGVAVGVFGSMAAPIIGAGLIAFAAYGIYENWDSISSSAERLRHLDGTADDWEAVGNIIGGIGAGINGAGRGLGTQVGEAAAKTVDGLAKTLVEGMTSEAMAIEGGGSLPSSIIEGEASGPATSTPKMPSSSISGASDIVSKIGEWLGEDFKSIVNKAGDKILLSKDGMRRFRVDINNPHGDSPHIHLEIKINGKWKDAFGKHRIYPKI